MSSTATPDARDFPCPVAGAVVHLDGTRHDLFGDGKPFPISVIFVATRCSGIPACGRVLRQPGCPMHQA